MKPDESLRLKSRGSSRDAPLCVGRELSHYYLPVCLVLITCPCLMYDDRLLSQLISGIFMQSNLTLVVGQVVRGGSCELFAITFSREEKFPWQFSATA